MPDIVSLGGNIQQSAIIKLDLKRKLPPESDPSLRPQKRLTSSRDAPCSESNAVDPRLKLHMGVLCNMAPTAPFFQETLADMLKITKPERRLEPAMLNDILVQMGRHGANAEKQKAATNALRLGLSNHLEALFIKRLGTRLLTMASLEEFVIKLLGSLIDSAYIQPPQRLTQLRQDFASWCAVRDEPGKNLSQGEDGETLSDPAAPMEVDNSEEPVTKATQIGELVERTFVDGFGPAKADTVRDEPSTCRQTSETVDENQERDHAAPQPIDTRITIHSNSSASAPVANMEIGVVTVKLFETDDGATEDSLLQMPEQHATQSTTIEELSSTSPARISTTISQVSALTIKGLALANQQPLIVSHADSRPHKRTISEKKDLKSPSTTVGTVSKEDRVVPAIASSAISAEQETMRPPQQAVNIGAAMTADKLSFRLPNSEKASTASNETAKPVLRKLSTSFRTSSIGEIVAQDVPTSRDTPESEHDAAQCSAVDSDHAGQLHRESSTSSNIPTGPRIQNYEHWSPNTSESSGKQREKERRWLPREELTCWFWYNSDPPCREGSKCPYAHEMKDFLNDVRGGLPISLRSRKSRGDRYRPGNVTSPDSAYSSGFDLRSSSPAASEHSTNSAVLQGRRRQPWNDSDPEQCGSKNDNGREKGELMGEVGPASAGTYSRTPIVDLLWGDKRIESFHDCHHFYEAIASSIQDRSVSKVLHTQCPDARGGFRDYSLSTSTCHKTGLQSKLAGVFSTDGGVFNSRTVRQKAEAILLPFIRSNRHIFGVYLPSSIFEG